MSCDQIQTIQNVNNTPLKSWFIYEIILFLVGGGSLEDHHIKQTSIYSKFRVETIYYQICLLSLVSN